MLSRKGNNHPLFRFGQHQTDNNIFLYQILQVAPAKEHLPDTNIGANRRNRQYTSICRYMPPPGSRSISPVTSKYRRSRQVLYTLAQVKDRYPLKLGHTAHIPKEANQNGKTAAIRAKCML